MKLTPCRHFKLTPFRGVIKQMVYEDYAGQCSGAYKHSAFLERLNVYMGMSKPSMRVPHKVGDKLFIDFTGKRLQVVDQETGEVQEVEVFVAILGCSQLTYVTAVASQKKEDFIAACERALHFYGGVPEAIVPDPSVQVHSKVIAKIFNPIVMGFAFIR